MPSFHDSRRHRTGLIDLVWQKMSSDQKIGAPFTLASLPRPINTGTGRTQGSGVCSISGTRKRKRTEISVAVDGEGVLIYSVGNSIQFFRDVSLNNYQASKPTARYVVRFTSSDIFRNVPVLDIPERFINPFGIPIHLCCHCAFHNRREKSDFMLH